MGSLFQNNPDFERRFITAFEGIQSKKMIVEKLGFRFHAGLSATMLDRRSEMTYTLLGKLVYRQDIALKYERYPEARRANQVADLAIRQSTRFPRRRQVAHIQNGDDILLANALQHLKTVSHTYSLITAPSKSYGLDFLYVKAWRNCCTPLRRKE